MVTREFKVILLPFTASLQLALQVGLYRWRALSHSGLIVYDLIVIFVPYLGGVAVNALTLIRWGWFAFLWAALLAAAVSFAGLVVALNMYGS